MGRWGERRAGHYKMMDGVCLSVHLSVWRVRRPNSRTEKSRKPKIGRMETNHTADGVQMKLDLGTVRLIESQSSVAVSFAHYIGMHDMYIRCAGDA